MSEFSVRKEGDHGFDLHPQCKGTPRTSTVPTVGVVLPGPDTGVRGTPVTSVTVESQEPVPRRVPCLSPSQTEKSSCY